MKSINLAKRYVIENKLDNVIVVVMWRKNAGGEYEGEFGDVIENKHRKNVGFPVSRDVDENK